MGQKRQTLREIARNQDVALAALRAIVDRGGPSVPVRSLPRPPVMDAPGDWDLLNERELPVSDTEPLAQMGVLNAILGHGSPKRKGFNPDDIMGMAGPIAAVPRTLKAIGTRGPIKAYHGSPHDFDQFKLEKIGTGEGAQAYGHGLYFAESPDVAKAYKQNLANGTYLAKDGMKDYGSLHGEMAAAAKAAARLHPDQARQIANYVLDGIDVYGSPEKYLAEFEFPTGSMGDAYKAALDAATGIKPNPGRMYEVNIHADPNDFLDWDAPLSQQSEVVKRIRPLGEKFKDVGEQLQPFEMNSSSGRSVYASIDRMIANDKALYEAHKVASRGGRGSDAAASEVLKQSGIPGIKYYDGGSRSPNVVDDRLHKLVQQHGGNVDAAVEEMGRGVYLPPKEKANWLAKMKASYAPRTRNYVVFDEKLIEIVKKYGIAGAVSAGLINQMQAQQLQEQGYQ